MNNKNYLLILLLPLVIFFAPVFFQGKMPIPADTIVGLYHPYRDVVWKGYSEGVPFKNFLITDAVRQQYPWRKLAIDQIKQGIFPGWNPYTHSGTPLSANPQTALWYPLNILFFLLPFNFAWSLEVILQPILLVLFMYLYLREIKLNRYASLISALSLGLCGFSVVWLEWNTTLHTLIWLPLGLLAIEKLFDSLSLRWSLAFIFSLSLIFLAGFLQTAFYAYILLAVYITHKFFVSQRKKVSKNKLFLTFLLLGFLVLLLTSVQWLPAFRLISHSARGYDQGNVLERQDWFIPWQNLIQILAPDFFGNPATLNYWGIFNYLEFIGYIGVAPLFFALLAVTSQDLTKNNNKKFFLIILFTSLVFATPNPIARLPFIFDFPLLSTAQPSRLLMLISFSLTALEAYGLNWFFKSIKSKSKESLSKTLFLTLLIFLLAYSLLWLLTLLKADILFANQAENIKVTQRNLLLPSAIALFLSFIITFSYLLRDKFDQQKKLFSSFLFLSIFIITTFDLLRFAFKFTPFSEPSYLYPTTKTIDFLKKDTSLWRYMTTDRRIMPPNFSIPYRIQTIEGYDPLYLRSYGQLIASAQMGRPATEPIAFKRIIRPDNYQSEIFDLLNVKYILSLADIDHPKLSKVFQEGETRVYQNNQAFPRAFLIDKESDLSEIQTLKAAFNLKKEDIRPTAQISDYQENRVVIEVEDELGGILILSDVYYPGWRVSVDGKPAQMISAFSALRGTIVPSGKHEVIFNYSQL